MRRVVCGEMSNIELSACGPRLIILSFVNLSFVMRVVKACEHISRPAYATRNDPSFLESNIPILTDLCCRCPACVVLEVRLAVEP